MLNVTFIRVCIFLFFCLASLFLYIGVYDDVVHMYVYVYGQVILLLIGFFVLFLRQKIIFSVFNIFSSMFVGYALGAFYYSLQTIEFGKFIGFTTIQTEKIVELYEVSLLILIAGYVFFTLGYVVSQFRSYTNLSISMSFIEKGLLPLYLYKSRWMIIAPFLSLGLISWWYVSLKTSGGIYESLIYFQAFRHMAKEAGVSTVLYNFYYAGMFYWLYLIVLNRKKIPIHFMLLSIIGMLMNLSQGQIMAPITYVLVQLVYVGVCRPKLQRKMIMAGVGAMVVALLLYFLRIASNLFYIGVELSFDKVVGDFFYKIIGSGNIADVQQIAIIYWSIEQGVVDFGFTFFDWAINIFSGILGLTPSSVGLTLKESFFPVESGAPTPGAIGEMYANFQEVSILLMFFVGLFLGIIQNVLLFKVNYFNRMLYAIFLMKFVFLYPKVDSTMFTSFVYVAFPLLLIVVCHVFLVLVLFSSRGRKINNA